MANDLNVTAPADFTNVASFVGMAFLEEPRGRFGAAVDALRRGVSVVPSAELLEEARSHLAAVLPHCRVAGEERIIGWLIKLADGVAGAPKPPEIRARSVALVEACRELPFGVWVPETRRTFWQRSKFWPVPQELFEHLQPYANTIRAHRAGAEAVLQAGTAGPEPERVLPSQAERDAVAAAWRSRKAEIEVARQAPTPGVDRCRISATPISDEMLLAISEENARAGSQLAAIRAQLLREKLQGRRADSPGGEGRSCAISAS